MLVLLLLIKQSISVTTHYGFWFQYLPFSNIKASGEFILNDKSIYVGQNVMANYNFHSEAPTQKLYVWLSFNSPVLNITVSDNGTITNLTQDPINFEGIWYYAYFENLEGGSKLYIRGSKLQSVALNTKNIIPVLNQYGKVNSLNFDYFHGKYSKVQGFTRLPFTNDKEFDDYFKSNLQSPQSYNKTIVDIFDGIQLLGDTFYSTQLQMLGYRYQVRCWVKVSFENVIERQRYLLMRLTLNENYRNDSFLGDRALLMSYILDPSSNNYNLFNVSVLAYPFPQSQLAFQTKNSNVFLIQNTTNRDRFQRWHYIYFQYLVEKTYLKVIYPNDQELTQTFSALQFHDQYVYLYVGADSYFYKSYLGGKIQLEITYNYEEEQSFQIRCHYSCLTCNGPTQSDCITCPQDTHRSWKYGFCACEFGFVDLELAQKCNKMNELYPIMNQTYQNNTFKCKYGEFQIDNKCMPCPSSINDYQLNCADCLLNAATWYQNPVCTFDYKRYSLISTYIRYDRNESLQEIFYINSQLQNLELCYGCLKYCNDVTKLTCIQYNQYYFSCKKGYFVSGNTCQKCMGSCRTCNNLKICIKCIRLYGYDGTKCQKCPINCVTCNSTSNCQACQPGFALFNGTCYGCGAQCSICEFYFDEIKQSYINRCLKCADPLTQEISFDALKCQAVTIKGCLYGISQYFIADQPQTTIDLYFQPMDISSLITSTCARCISGQSFSNLTFVCYKSSQLCQESGFYNGTFYCLIGGEQATSILGCELKLQNCYECVNYLNKVICINCFPGYYADHIVGMCVQCPNGCLSCSQQFKKNKSNWKKDIRPFYEFYVNKNLNHDYLTYVESSNPNDFEVICTGCKIGYEVYNDSCINKCPSDCSECLIVNNSKICSKCSYSSNGLILSTSNKICYQCHSLCKFCAPATDVNITQFTNQCLLPFSQDSLFDSNIYQFSNCPDESACQMSMSITLNLICLQGQPTANVFDIPYNQESDLSFVFQLLYSKGLFNYMNEQNVQTLNIYLTTQTCTFPKNLVISQEFSANVYSLKNVSLYLLGMTSNSTIYFSGDIYIKEFHSFWIKNLNIDCLNASITFNFNLDQTNIGFQNANFQGSGFIHFEYANLNTFSMINMKFAGFQFSNLESLLKVEPIQSVIIQNVQLFNLNLTNSTLFKFQNVQELILNQITVESNNLKQSTLFAINQQGEVHFFVMKLSTLEISFAFQGQDLQFNQLQILMNFIIDSSSICQSSELQLQNSLFEANYITQNSYLIRVIQKTLISDIILDKVQFSLNYITQFSSFLYVESSTLLQITNLNMFMLSMGLDVNVAFQILTNSFSLYDSVIEFQDQISALIEATDLDLFSFKNITIHQQNQLTGLSGSLNCITLLDSNKPIINLLNIKKVDFQIVNFTNIFTYNQPVIKIGSTQVNFKCLININNSTFQDSLIIKSTNNITVAFIVIESKNSISINFTNSKFLNTIYKEYIGLNTYGTSANNLYFLIPQGSVYFYNNSFRSNLIIGSLNSNMYIQCQKVIISNCSFTEINNPNKLFYQVHSSKYEDLLYMEQLEYDYKVKSYGGIAQIYVEEIQISNSYFETYIGYKGGCMYVITLNNGIVSIVNTQFKNGQAIIGQLESQGGSFIIDSKGSKLNFQIINCTIQNSWSFDKGGFVMITLSDQSSVKFQNVSINDAHSLQSSVISIEISDFLQQQYTLQVEDCIIQNTKAGYNDYLKLIEIKDLIYKFTFDTYDSVLFETQKGIIRMKNLVIHNIIGYGLMTNKQSYSVIIDTVDVINFIIQKRPLVFFDRSIGQIIIMNSHFHGVYQNYTKIICVYSEYQLEELKSECSNEPYTLHSQFNSYTKQCEENITISQDYQTYDIFQLSNIESEVQINSVIFSDIQCTLCNIFYIETNNRVVIQQTKFIKNVGNSSILNIQKTYQNRLLFTYANDLVTRIGEILIKDTQFIQNKGVNGGCILAAGVSISCYSVLFQNNTAVIGGAIYLNDGSLEMTDSKIIGNRAAAGAGIYSTNPLSIQKNRRNVILDNQESSMVGNLQSQPSKLALSLDTFRMFENKVSYKNDTCLIEEVINEIMLPNNVEIQNYQILEENLTEHGLGNQLSYVSNFETYNNLNYKFRLVPQNAYNERQYNLSDTQCSVRSRLMQEKQLDFSSEHLSIDNVQFNMTTQDYNLDNLRLLINEDLQIEIRCDSIKIPIYDSQFQHILQFHNNYSIIINVKSFPCQRGEVLTKSICVQCVSQTYSLKENSLKCSVGDQEMIESVIPSNIEIKPTYWRPYYDNDIIYPCIISSEKCLGGWVAGPDSCIQGSFGALCETCDIYDVRGQGSFFKSNMNCFQCQDSNLAYFSLLIVALWTMISMVISVNSSLENLKLELLRSKLKKGGLKTYSEQQESSSLYKMLFHYLQIISTLTTFQLQFPNLVSIAISSVGSQTKSLENSIDCFLMTIPYDILHSRIIWIILAPLIYLGFVFFLYMFIIFARKQQYKQSVSAIILLQTFVTMQPSMIGVLISIIGFRQISGYYWVIGDVSYRYDKNFYVSAILAFPILFSLSIVIPLLMFIKLYKNKDDLNKIKSTWGYLFSEFNENAYFWEIVRLGMKNLVIIIITLFDQYIVLKATMVFLLIQGYQSLTKSYQPFKTKNLNQMEDFGSKVLSISIVLGASSYQMLLTVMRNYIYIFYVIILEVNCTFLYYIFSKIISEYTYKNQILINKIKDYLKLKFPMFMRLSFCKKLFSPKQSSTSSMKFRKVTRALRESLQSQRKKNFLDLQQDESVIQMQSPDHLLKSNDHLFKSREQKLGVNCSGSMLIFTDQRDSKLHSRIITDRQGLQKSIGGQLL
ncbi:unnamed protein product (macronuclear) [Paramecium tetraurelia]|uniref:TNFR-Cys domain-containing protein n=1 Tax=Paramecium tetraurelia TaxID=5888 RepID=A0DM02_PARTE|nr:uncharacterized protein GSPATT00018287001 [Paramecium tetraurelia]CAK84069.1 unnamed protein product [Paramecium tetraurelia]|eukprot:XP_001451466.1 hypothetical protein (macronuclear) [Paramecium tetraurelia strain d4-2]